MKKVITAIVCLLSLLLCLPGAAASGNGIGIQLYSMRDYLGTPEGYAKNHEFVFSQLADMGYSYVESAIYENRKFHGVSPQQFKADVEAAGLKFRSSHLRLDLTPEQIATGDFSEAMKWWADAVEDHKAAGVEYMIMSSIEEVHVNVEATLKVYAAYFNAIGKMVSDAGMQFGYHNHDTEFEKIEKVRFYDYMIRNTDPKLVFYQMDLYWITHAGTSPVRYFRHYPGRYKVLHARDEAEIGKSGLVGYDAIFANSGLAGVKDVVVELGGSSYNDMLRTARESADYLLNTMPRVLEEHVERMAAERKEAILSSPNTVDPAKVSGKCYFVSAEGNDANDGLSAQTPFKSLSKVYELELNPGDAVLFRRGDVWRKDASRGGRDVLKGLSGVTYSAYGEGPKPRLYGSPCNGAVEGKWKKTCTPNIYVYSLKFGGDVGGIILDDKCSAFKVIKRMHGGKELHVDTLEPFESWKDLKRDLDFYQDGEKLYLCSTEGNPAKRFSSIEFNVHGHGIRPADNVTIDNLCFRYIGSHAIGSGTTEGLTVTNCEVGWTGGSLQPGFNIPGREHPTRYGNGIEVYGGCKMYTIENCYVYQCYDAGITHQYSTHENVPFRMDNVTYRGNLIEDCVYSIEYFHQCAEDPSVDRMISNMVIEDNICLRAGYGWGSQRPDKKTPSHIKTWRSDNPMEKSVIRNNYFAYCTHEFINIYAKKPEWYPELENNVMIR